MMILSLLFFVIAISAVVAELEIQIEGKNGWAGDLPTWRINNKVTSFILGGAYHPLTGYHFFLSIFVMLFFHFPFFVGLPWSGSLELKILSSFFLFWMIEDFLWFVLNPHFGIHKFREIHIPWHKNWIWIVPRNGIFLGFVFLILSGFIR